MKNLLLFVVFLVCFASLSPQMIFATEENAEEHKALRELKVKVENAINASDIESLSSVLAEDFLFITADQTVITTKEDLFTYYEKLFKAPDSLVTSMKTAITATVPTIFTSPVTGYCYGTSIDTYTLRDGKKIAIDTVWSTQLEKIDGAWKVKVAHTGVNFIDNPVLEAKGMSILKKVGVMLKLSSYPGEVQE